MISVWKGAGQQYPRNYSRPSDNHHSRFFSRPLQNVLQGPPREAPQKTIPGAFEGTRQNIAIIIGILNEFLLLKVTWACFQSSDRVTRTFQWELEGVLQEAFQRTRQGALHWATQEALQVALLGALQSPLRSTIGELQRVFKVHL